MDAHILEQAEELAKSIAGQASTIEDLNGVMKALMNPGVQAFDEKGILEVFQHVANALRKPINDLDKMLIQWVRNQELDNTPNVSVEPLPKK